MSKVRNMYLMFSDASAFSQPVEAWDVSSATIVEGMFMDASAFNQPIEPWAVSSATTMGVMLKGASAFKQPLGAWKVPKSPEHIRCLPTPARSVSPLGHGMCQA